MIKNKSIPVIGNTYGLVSYYSHIIYLLLICWGLSWSAKAGYRKLVYSGFRNELVNEYLRSTGTQSWYSILIFIFDIY